MEPYIGKALKDYFKVLFEPRHSNGNLIILNVFKHLIKEFFKEVGSKAYFIIAIIDVKF